MKNCRGMVSSIYNGSALDGPGIRCVIFMAGCNLRCPFCHNPETFDESLGKAYTAKELSDYVLRYKSYISKGGVTFSGGEPFLQAEFCRGVALMLKRQGIDTAAETNGHIIDKEFISALDLLIVDIKNQSEISGRVIDFLNECGRLNKKVIITNVIIKGVNDGADKLLQLKKLISGFDNIQKIKFLPFKKLCICKYRQLNIDFPYKDKEEVTSDYIEKTEKLYNSL